MLAPYGLDRGSDGKPQPQSSRWFCGYCVYAACVKATIDDPSTYTRQWTLKYPFLATEGPVYEYACHEVNYAMPDILGGARKIEGEGK